MGPLTLRVPQTRDGSFSTTIFRRYQRHEQAFMLGLMEMYLQGVSTRKVTHITEELCGAHFSKSKVSELCTNLDARLKAWQGRSLSDKRYPFLLVDALVVDICRDKAIRPSGVLIAYGINEAGQREPLDLLVADSENEASWEELFQRLKEPGLQGVDLVVSDNHNLRNEVAEQLKIIFTAETKAVAEKLAKEFITTYETKAAKAVDIFESGYAQALTVLTFPKHYRRRLRTTNLPERMNEEIRRRQRVIRIFPNEASALRLIGCLLADQYEKWQMQDRYFDMKDYWDWKLEIEQTKKIKLMKIKTTPLCLLNDFKY